MYWAMFHRGATCLGTLLILWVNVLSTRKQGKSPLKIVCAGVNDCHPQEFIS